MSEDELDIPDDRRPPMPAIILGVAGLLPLVIALLVRLAAGIEPDTPLPGLIGSFALIYSALILSFLGGIWWGVAISRAAADQFARLLALAIVPTVVSLLLIGLMFARPVLAAILLGLAIIATPLVDLGLSRRGLVPAWWMTLRVPLSIALGVLTIGLALALG